MWLCIPWSSWTCNSNPILQKGGESRALCLRTLSCLFQLHSPGLTPLELGNSAPTCWNWETRYREEHGDWGWTAGILVLAGVGVGEHGAPGLSVLGSSHGVKGREQSTIGYWGSPVMLHRVCIYNKKCFILKHFKIILDSSRIIVGALSLF